MLKLMDGGANVLAGNIFFDRYPFSTRVRISTHTGRAPSAHSLVSGLLALKNRGERQSAAGQNPQRRRFRGSKQARTTPALPAPYKGKDSPIVDNKNPRIRSPSGRAGIGIMQPRPT